jgi:hypothetical protein
MSEYKSPPDAECEGALGMMCQAVDGDLTGEQSAWLDRHLAVCAACREAMDRLTAVDREVIRWGQRVDREESHRPLLRWLAAAAVIAAAVSFAMVAPHRKRAIADRSEAPFIEIPYLPALDARENTAIVRMNIRVATLHSFGLHIDGDPEARVAVDVLVGEDGRAHAVRVVSDIDGKRTGE